LDIDPDARALDAARMTLADLLMSTALLGLTAGATMITLEQGQRVWAAGATAVETQQSARAALTWLAAELRAAGQGNSGDALPALSVAEPSRLVLHLDRNRDGVIAGAPESVTWRLAGDVLRREAGGGAQPVINGVRALAFTYLDADQRATSDPAAVRRISITLTTRPDHTRTVATQDLGATLTTDVALRNP
jgi:type II secretory pathway component PulJ